MTDITALDHIPEETTTLLKKMFNNGGVFNYPHTVKSLGFHVNKLIKDGYIITDKQARTITLTTDAETITALLLL